MSTVISVILNRWTLHFTNIYSVHTALIYTFFNYQINNSVRKIKLNNYTKFTYLTPIYSSVMLTGFIRSYVYSLYYLFVEISF